jgi:hypothetical protein
MAAKTPKIEPLPLKQDARIGLVGETLYGRDYRRRMADGLGISRSTLWEWIGGAGKNRDIDGKLIDLLDAEADATTQRGLTISALRRRFLATRRQSDAAL